MASPIKNIGTSPGRDRNGKDPGRSAQVPRATYSTSSANAVNRQLPHRLYSERWVREQKRSPPLPPSATARGKTKCIFSFSGELEARRICVQVRFQDSSGVHRTPAIGDDMRKSVFKIRRRDLTRNASPGLSSMPQGPGEREVASRLYFCYPDWPPMFPGRLVTAEFRIPEPPMLAVFF
jgi:hypothetical protein